MVDKHSSLCWKCSWCASDYQETEPQAPRRHDFWTAEAWQDHVTQRHKDRIKKFAQLPVLAELSKRRIIGPLACPLCDFSTETTDSRIDGHILQHLHEFSLWALPHSGVGAAIPAVEDEVKERIWGYLIPSRHSYGGRVVILRKGAARTSTAGVRSNLEEHKGKQVVSKRDTRHEAAIQESNPVGESPGFLFGRSRECGKWTNGQEGPLRKNMLTLIAKISMLTVSPYRVDIV